MTEVHSLGNRLTHLMEQLTNKVKKQEKEPREETNIAVIVSMAPQRSTVSATADYDKTTMIEGGMVQHPYSPDCPFCLHISGGDAIAQRRSLGTVDMMRR